MIDLRGKMGRESGLDCAGAPEEESVSYGYDDNGNQTSRDSDTFEYDHENRLTEAVIGGNTSTYAYDGDGLRDSQTVGENAVSYTWDVNAGLPVVLQDSDGNSYVYGLDLISATDDSSVQTYFLTDGLGSTSELADDDGTVTGTYAYDAFGPVRTHTGATTEWSYTGEQNDATGLEYLRTRYYDPAVGRYLSRDPLPFIQRYAYVGNNPTTFIDPYGLFCIGPKQLCDKVGDVVGGAGDIVGGAIDAGGDLLGAAGKRVGAALEGGWEVTRTVARSPAGALICSPATGMLGCGIVAAANADRIASFASRFATTECLGLVLDASAFGADFVPLLGAFVGPAAFAGGIGLDAKEGDFVGLTLDTVSEIVAPFQAIPGAGQVAAGSTAGVAGLYSLGSCVLSGF
jgi:RHS repeat-associated protein